MNLRVIEGGKHPKSKAKAAEVIGYAVESDLEGGFLVNAAPSVWAICLESAVRYETPSQAWASAKRRGSALAEAIAVVREGDGSLSWEPVADPSKSTEGDWIVWFDSKSGGGRLYVVKNGKRGTASSRRTDAKGYKNKLAAEKVAQQFADGVAAGIEQVTAGSGLAN
ncbi:hypothetical protein HX878_20765 [Pseudomonas veronii]|jgi:hypothetical protein|uniref:hypothetical protein n=1 Tax=Pseudomonas veronii TaxID=76761 RepID=UPI0015A33F2F|nr:hypothetical protein [Pseudomonas veronii]NWD57167.1 hypothetical protein [Pseudomonas veronii]